MKNKKKVLSLLLVIVLIVGCIGGCASLGSWLQSLKGELFGNSYTIWEYDNFGECVMTLKGDKIALEGEVDENGELASSYINITVDGHEWEHVGGTLVFCQNDVDMITNFQVPDKIIESDEDSSGLIAIDRVVNNYKNMIGKKRVVIVYSQTGAPICMFQGDKCYTEVPEDLPKTTQIYIDGDLVYVHRANIDILDAELLE